MVIATKSYNNKVIDKGTFSPATTLTSGVDRYQNFKYGWLICYGMNEYSGNYYNQINTVNNPPDKSVFNPVDVDVKSWAVTAKSKGVDYAVLTVENEFGFAIRRSKVPFNMSRQTLSTGQLSPYNDYPYCVSGQADPNILEKFVVEFRQRGIEPIPYMCFFTHFNFADGLLTNLNSSTLYLNQKVDYFCRAVQDLIIKYNFNYFWFDIVPSMPAGVVQKLYNAAKSINPNIVIIGNVAGETSFATYPYDVESTEEYAIYGGNVGYQTNSRTHGGTTYFVGQEIVATPCGTNSQWYYFDQYCQFQPAYTKMAFQSVGTFQGIVNSARTYKRPFLVDMMINRQGNLVSEMVSFLDQINFS